MYRSVEEGLLRPVMPARCVFAQDRERCRFRVHHYRSRKTGPCFALAVVGCLAHPDGRYTLYPAGHVPYGRVAVAPVSASGTLYLHEATGRPRWEATLHAAALDAAGGVRWSEESPFDDLRRRRTQGRRLDLAGHLLGVHPSMEARIRERVATRLSVPLMTLGEASRSWGTSWTSRGRAILAVLDAIPVQASLPGRILAAGAAGGLWAEPRWWGHAGSHSGGPERAPPATPGTLSPRPTTSPVPEEPPAE